MAQNPFFTSMCREQWPSPPTLVFPGYVSFANSVARECISAFRRMGPDGRSVVECYRALWICGFNREERTGDQHDAYSIAAWLRQADQDGSLARYSNPALKMAERALAEVEGWILGVE